MLFDRIRLHNFQSYAGDFEITFPDPDKQESFVVLLAPNNTGKSTIIRALKFLFYGDIGNRSTAMAWELVNERIREASDLGENVQAYVEARVRMFNDEPITIRRSLRIRRSTVGGQWLVEGPILRHKKNDNAAVEFGKDDGFVHSRISRAVPEELFNWFYFHGEPADGKMAHGSSDGLRQSLQKVIQIQRWEDSEALVSRLIGKLESEQAAEVGNNAQYEQTKSQLKAVEDGRLKTQEQVVRCNELLEEGAAKMLILEEKIDERAKNAEEATKMVGHVRALEAKRSESERIAEKAAADLCDRINRIGGLPFLSPLFDEIDLRLEGLRKRNLLPADVSKPFIKRVIEQQECICGRVHSDETIKRLQTYLEETLAIQTNSDLLELSRQLDPKNGTPFKARLNGQPEEIARLRSLENASRSRVAEITRELNSIAVPDSEKLGEFEILIKERRTLGAKIENIKEKLGEFRQTLARQDQAIKKYREELRNIASKKRGGKVSDLDDKLNKARNLLEVVTKGKEQFQASVASILRRNLSELFDSAVTSRNKAAINSRTFLPVIINQLGQVERDPGGGEKQVLELAFVIALSELRREINESVRKAGLGGALLGPQSFVLDSPFTSVDTNYMRVIAEFLPGKARQMILLVAKQNWHDTIRTALEGHVTMAYAIRLHTSAEIKEPDAFRFQFKGRNLDLLKKLPGKEPSFTTFEKVEIA